MAEVRFPLYFRRTNSARAPAATASIAAARAAAGNGAETEKPARGNTAGDGARHGACGMLGGEDGHAASLRAASDGREPRVLQTKEVGIEMRPGDCLEIESGGGGGWGDLTDAIGARRARRDREQGLTDAPERSGARRHDVQDRR